ncbi:IclR family transcriptional regulator [Jatrophihabitans endophyticus]|uniref:IclR family transcriptional regulator n=1 Tax=Jatrophihabitans endophyticus TaxID=1206085 RepID=UPI001A012532|nr:IclR family transcriptional regulator [Jatrophihabitans endophyticus]MBE7190685.1 IclR family transcriptional regulator [Jatrophihabitans endophyticus]
MTTSRLAPILDPSDRDRMGSVDNALRILLVLGERGSLRVTDAADELGIARSTAHRLLTALRARGFVVQDARRTYRPGPALVQRDQRRSRSDFVALLHPVLEFVRHETSETCHLTVLEGNGIRFIDCAESLRVLRVTSRFGMLLPAHNIAAGKVLLAELTVGAFTAMYPRGVPGPIGDPMERRAALQRQLVSIRRRGFATNFGESESGMSAGAVPLRDGSGRVIAAIGLACPSSRCSRSTMAHYVQVMLDAAQQGQDLLTTQDEVRWQRRPS